MADDPPDDTREKIVADWCPDINVPGRRTLLAELDRVDPLRALLADENRAVEAMTAAWFESLHPRRWADCSERVKEHHRRHFGPVLAALREVAGL